MVYYFKPVIVLLNIFPFSILLFGLFAIYSAINQFIINSLFTIHHDTRDRLKMNELSEQIKVHEGAKNVHNRNLETEELRIKELYRNLLIKNLHDKEVVNRLIEFERNRNPNATKAELLQSAIDRWERDNR